MVRSCIKALSFSIALLGCAGPTLHSATADLPPKDTPFGTEEQKMLACLDLRDHIVSLYADEYVAENNLSLDRAERVAFRSGWAEELARKGTFDRFEQTCVSGLTPHKYECGMASKTTDGLVACMKFSSR